MAGTIFGDPCKQEETACKSAGIAYNKCETAYNEAETAYNKCETAIKLLRKPMKHQEISIK